MAFQECDWLVAENCCEAPESVARTAGTAREEQWDLHRGVLG